MKYAEAEVHGLLQLHAFTNNDPGRDALAGFSRIHVNTFDDPGAQDGMTAHSEVRRSLISEHTLFPAGLSERSHEFIKLRHSGTPLRRRSDNASLYSAPLLFRDPRSK